MNLNIENFAKIKKVDIDILGITVIAGENNTGKSTIGKVLYCLFECFHDIEKKLMSEKKRALRMHLRRHLEVLIDRDQHMEYKRCLQEIISIKEETYTNKTLLDEALDDIFRELLRNISDFTSNHRIMADIKSYVYSLLNQSIDVVRDTLINKYFNMEFDKQALPLFEDCGESVITLTLQKEIIKMMTEAKSHTRGLEFRIKEYVNIFHELVYIDNPDILDEAQFYRPWRNRDCMNHEDNLRMKLQKGKTEDNIFEETMAHLSLDNVLYKINEIIHGDFVATKDYLGFQERGVCEPLHLSNLSTGLKGFVLIKKLIEDGYIKKKGIIVLDEPEVHLHPKWQLLYAEILVILQKELDLNIILTSHSPYFINAVEVYSAKYEIADKCKYYLSDLMDDKAVFEDVTTNIDKIYEKLAMPLQELEDIASE